MSLDVHVRNILDQMAQLKLPKFSEIGPQAARAAMRSRIVRGDDTPIGRIEDRKIPGPGGDLAVRVYTPLGATEQATLAGLVFFHGGGFVVGDIETHDDLCRNLANGS